MEKKSQPILFVRKEKEKKFTSNSKRKKSMSESKYERRTIILLKDNDKAHNSFESKK